MMKLFQLLTLGIVTLIASGCVSLLPETAPPKPRYHLSAGDSESLTGPTVDWSLVIDDPRTTRIYDSVRIAVSTAPGKIEYYAGAEWADRAPRLAQSALAQTFENSGRILAVGDRSTQPVGDLILHLDIRALELDVRSGNPSSRVAVYARLTDGKGTVHAARRFQASSNAGSERADDVVSAIDSAFNQIILDVARWTFDEGDAAQS